MSQTNNTKLRVAKNYVYNITYQILIVIVPLITTPYISRVLRPTGVGIYSYTYTIATAFSLVAGLGINTYGQRQVAYYQNDKEIRSIIFWELFLLRVIITTFCLLIYFILCYVYKEYTYYLLLNCFIIIAVILDISWFYQGLEQFGSVAIKNIMIKIFTLVFCFILVRDSNDVDIYISINSLSFLFSNLFLFFNLKKYIYPIKIRQLNIKRHIIHVLAFFLPLIATHLYSQLDKLLLGILTNDIDENGFYEQARKIVSLVVSIISALNSVMFSRISNLYKEGEKNKIIEWYKVTYKIILLLLCPMATGLYFVSDNFVGWFLGDGYTKVISLLKLSSILIPFMSIGNFVGLQFLCPMNLQSKMTIIYFFSAVINFILNIIFIPKYLAIGALCSSICAEFLSCILQVYLLKKSEYSFKMTDGIDKYILSSICMAIGLLILNTTSLSGIMLTIIQIILGTLIYVISLFILKEQNIYYLVRKLLHRL